MAKILDEINKPNDIKNIPKDKYKDLASEIRGFLIEKISKNGGHLASNLGVVELTMALHLVLDFPKDKLIFDVGHQSYTHKILTGRKQQFNTLRNYKGLSGFPKIKESNCDAFDTGHSSTSISIALGYAKARELNNENYNVVAVIGDGALSGGMAYEALNNAARLKSNMIIVLNDNTMSISKNVGGMSHYLSKMRTNTKYLNLKDSVEKTLEKIPIGDIIIDKIKHSKDLIKRFLIADTLFEDMGITYIGPIDGHDIKKLTQVLENAKRIKGAVLIHVITKKGKGYAIAQKYPAKFHGVEPFNIRTGEPIRQDNDITYTEVFADELIKNASENEKIVAITAAMKSGTGLDKFASCFPKRFFDVGIAEEHAVTFAGGLAMGGLKPVIAIYSTFLQRAYDQILHDICIENLNVMFAIDRSGIVGKDGDTHQGIFDISYLSTMPNLTIIAPKNELEFKQMIKFAINYNGAIALRYPKGEVYKELTEFNAPIEFGKSEILYDEGEICLLAYGSMVKTAVEVRNILKEKNILCGIVNLRFIAPIDTDTIDKLLEKYKLFVTLEENVKHGGFGEKFSSYLFENNIRYKKHINISIKDQFVEHGFQNILRKELGLDAESIAERILNVYKNRKTKKK